MAGYTQRASKGITSLRLDPHQSLSPSITFRGRVPSIQVRVQGQVQYDLVTAGGVSWGAGVKGDQSSFPGEGGPRPGLEASSGEALWGREGTIPAGVPT